MRRALPFCALGLLPLLTACMNLSGLSGSSGYACQAPEGVACDSVSGTYANALRNNLPSQRSRRTAAEDKGFVAERPRPSADDTPLVPSPLRSSPRVLRLWIKPWEDADGDLFDQGYVYVQVDNGQWLIDHVQRKIRDAYGPLKAPPKPAAEPVDTNANTTMPGTSLPRLPARPSGGPQ
ncbi:MAG: conjugal transfer protein TraV [Rhodocyclaceae bacterium]|nr:MAG: conjugal transfer protein TraV [Rhodocyclaceae bacterium]